MDLLKYINKNSWEIEDEPEGYIPVDSKIAKTIMILNKKGYITKSSCAGHHDIRFVDMDEADILYLEKFKSDPRTIIKSVRDDEFDYWEEVAGSAIYIVFADAYEFLNIPEGFEYADNTLKYNIDYYNDLERKSIPQINEEINKYNKILESWAKNLPVKGKDD